MASEPNEWKPWTIYLGALALVLGLFLILSESSNARNKDELDQLKRERVVCPMCGGSGVVTLPETKGVKSDGD